MRPSSPALIDWKARASRGRQTSELISHVSKNLEERLRFFNRDFSRIFRPEIGENIKLEEGKYDCVHDLLTLHWSDDLSSRVLDIKNILEKGGVFLGALFGEHTLQELKAVFMYVEEQLYGRITPRFLPLPTAHDLASLLQSHGFHAPVVDREVIVREYDALSGLFDDLRRMGETNCLKGRFSGLTTPHFMKVCEEFYRSKFQTKENKVYATFEVLYLMAWQSG